MEIQANWERFDRDLVATCAQQLREHVLALCSDGTEGIVPPVHRTVAPDPILPLTADNVEAVPAAVARAVSTGIMHWDEARVLRRSV